jgi:glucokinase
VSAVPASVLAVDVGGTGIKASVVDQAGVVIRGLTRPTPAAGGQAAVLAAVRQAAGELSGPEIVAAGVVVPGEVDVQAGVARYSANLGWRDVPLRDLLAADLAVPVVLEHDVRAAGIAEHAIGRARGVAECLVLVIGTGIAGVCISGGVILRGATDLAGEIGHIPVHPDGEGCACGQRGCLETYASAASIARRYRELSGAAADSAASATARDSTASATARDIAVRRESDSVARQVWADAVNALALALATYTMLLDPEIVVLGGGLAEAGAALLEPLRPALDARLSWRSAPALQLSTLAGCAGQFGAAILAWQLVADVDVGSWTPQPRDSWTPQR